MGDTVYQFSVFCVEENKFTTQWGTALPTICTTDVSHTSRAIDTSKTTIIDTVAEQVNIYTRGEVAPTGPSGAEYIRGWAPMVIRKDVAGSLVGVEDGDMTALQVNDQGELRVTTGEAGASAPVYGYGQSVSGTSGAYNIDGNALMVVRRDFGNGDLVDVDDGDMTSLHVDADGHLNVHVPGMAFDAASRLEVSQTLTLGDYRYVRDQSDIVSQGSVGTGNSIAFNASTNSCRMIMGGTNAGYAMMQSKSSHPYFSGKAQQIEFTMFNFQPQTNIVKRIGYFYHPVLTTPAPATDAIDGIYLENDGTNVRLRVSREGTTILNVPQSQWNRDKLDGSGPSKYVIDWSLFNVFLFDFLYLGGAILNFYVFTNGVRHLVHRFVYPNTEANTFIGSPQLPLSASIHSTTTASGQFDFACAQISSMGPSSIFDGVPISITKLGAAYATGGPYTVLGIRMNPTSAINRNGVIRFKKCSLSCYDGASNNIDRARWSVVIIPQSLITTAPTWVDAGLPGNIVQTSITNSTLTATLQPFRVLVSGTVVGQSSSSNTEINNRRIGVTTFDLSNAENWEQLWLIVENVNASEISASLDVEFIQ